MRARAGAPRCCGNPSPAPDDAEEIMARLAAEDACFAATLVEEAARFPN